MLKTVKKYWISWYVPCFLYLQPGRVHLTPSIVLCPRAQQWLPTRPWPGHLSTPQTTTVSPLTPTPKLPKSPALMYLPIMSTTSPPLPTRRGVGCTVNWVRVSSSSNTWVTNPPTTSCMWTPVTVHTSLAPRRDKAQGRTTAKNLLGKGFFMMQCFRNSYTESLVLLTISYVLTIFKKLMGSLS